ncbi:hypothetical protein VPHF86_0161 [Vibrio phage F86]
MNHVHRAKAVDYGRGEYADDYGNELEDRVFSDKKLYRMHLSTSHRFMFG